MKAVVIGEPSGMTMDQIMEVFPRHRAVIDRFYERGEIIGMGPFEDLGNMVIFRSREAAEEYVATDAFVLEGVVVNVRIRDWNDSMLT